MTTQCNGQSHGVTQDGGLGFEFEPESLQFAGVQPSLSPLVGAVYTGDGSGRIEFDAKIDGRGGRVVPGLYRCAESGAQVGAHLVGLTKDARIYHPREYGADVGRLDLGRLSLAEAGPRVSDVQLERAAHGGRRSLPGALQSAFVGIQKGAERAAGGLSSSGRSRLNLLSSPFNRTPLLRPNVPTHVAVLPVRLDQVGALVPSLPQGERRLAIALLGVWADCDVHPLALCVCGIRVAVVERSPAGRADADHKTSAARVLAAVRKPLVIPACCLPVPDCGVRELAHRTSPFAIRSRLVAVYSRMESDCGGSLWIEQPYFSCTWKDAADLGGRSRKAI